MMRSISGMLRSATGVFFLHLSMIFLFPTFLITTTTAYSDEKIQTLEFPICIMSPLFQTPAAMFPIGLTNLIWVRWTKIAMLAARHVNTRNCAVLGPGCDKVLSVGEGVEIKLDVYFSDLHGSLAINSPRAVQKCLETNAQVVVGATTSEQSSLVTAFVSGLSTSYLYTVVSSII